MAGPKYVTPQFPIVGTGKAGKTTSVKAVIEIGEGFHIQSNPASRSNLIPTKFDVPNIKVEYPKGSPYQLQSGGQAISVYSGKVEFPIEVDVPANAKGKYSLKGKFRYQACNSQTCFFPITEPVEILIDVK